MGRLHEAVKRLKVVRGESHFDKALTHGHVMWAWAGVMARKLPVRWASSCG